MTAENKTKELLQKRAQKLAGRRMVDDAMAHFKALYMQSDAEEIAARTGLTYDEAACRFELTLVGITYYVAHPIFEVFSEKAADEAGNRETKTEVSVDTVSGATVAPGYEVNMGGHTPGGSVLSPYEEILIMRYLLEGAMALSSGKMLAYDEMPWGSVYMKNFQERVLGRIAGEFGKDPEQLKTAVEGIVGLDFEKVDKADSAYRFEFMNGLNISILVWAGDDEFSPSAQMLFSDNFKHAFTAEDMAVVGDIVIHRLKQSLKR